MTTQTTLRIPKKSIANSPDSPEDIARDGETRGGRHYGVCYPLAEIDPSTLPDEDDEEYWAEVRRRVDAYYNDVSGWRTGDFGEEDADLAEWGVDR